LEGLLATRALEFLEAGAIGGGFEAVATRDWVWERLMGERGK
jgi:hypothetical protein